MPGETAVLASLCRESPSRSRARGVGRDDLETRGLQRLKRLCNSGNDGNQDISSILRSIKDCVFP